MAARHPTLHWVGKEGGYVGVPLRTQCANPLSAPGRWLWLKVLCLGRVSWRCQA